MPGRHRVRARSCSVAFSTSGSCSISEARLRAQAVQRAGMDQRFEHPAIELARVDALAEIQQVAERRLPRARIGDGLAGAAADALDRAQAVADGAWRQWRWNMKSEALTSGGSTFDADQRAASSRKSTTLSVLSMSEDSVAAMNSAG